MEHCFKEIFNAFHGMWIRQEINICWSEITSPEIRNDFLFIASLRRYKVHISLPIHYAKWKGAIGLAVIPPD